MVILNPAINLPFLLLLAFPGLGAQAIKIEPPDDDFLARIISISGQYSPMGNGTLSGSQKT